MKNSSSSMILWVIALPLLFFTGFRSIHLIQSTLPQDAQIIAFAALAGLDGGLLAWLYFAMSGAHGNQRTVAIADGHGNFKVSLTSWARCSKL